MFRSAYDGKRVRVEADIGGPSLTKQSFKKDCDIQVILKQFDRTGLVTHMNRYPAGYADVSNMGDFRQAMGVVLEAEKMFSTLPSKIRARFGNDPGNFLEFVGNPENADEMVSLGLATKREPVVKEVSGDGGNSKEVVRGVSSGSSDVGSGAPAGKDQTAASK